MASAAAAAAIGMAAAKHGVIARRNMAAWHRKRHGINGASADGGRVAASA